MSDDTVYRAVLVEWVDSRVLELYQVSDDELPTPCTVRSVGWLVKSTSEYLAIARERIDDDWRGVLVIPRVSIVCQQGLNGSSSL